jgi:hypothetical protein
MVVAEQREIVQLRRTTFRERDHMVDLEAARGSTTWYDATSIPGRQRDPEATADRPTEARYRTNISRLVKDEAEERIICQVASHQHRDRSLAVDLAALARMDPTSEKGIEVDTDHQIATRWSGHDRVVLLRSTPILLRWLAVRMPERCRHGGTPVIHPRTPSFIAHKEKERIGAKCTIGLSSGARFRAFLAGAGAPKLAGEPFEPGADDRAPISSVAALEAERPFRIGPPGEMPTGMDPTGRRDRISLFARCSDLLAVLLRSPQRLLRRVGQQRLLRVRIGHQSSGQLDQLRLRQSPFSRCLVTQGKLRECTSDLESRSSLPLRSTFERGEVGRAGGLTALLPDS